MTDNQIAQVKSPRLGHEKDIAAEQNMSAKISACAVDNDPVHHVPVQDQDITGLDVDHGTFYGEGEIAVYEMIYFKKVVVGIAFFVRLHIGGQVVDDSDFSVKPLFEYKVLLSGHSCSFVMFGVAVCNAENAIYYTNITMYLAKSACYNYIAIDRKVNTEG